MKKTKFLISILSFAFAICLLLTSCESENDDLPLEQVPNKTENNINAKSRALSSQNVYRYYSGGSASLHTYKTQGGQGIGIGSREGISFRTTVAGSHREIDFNTYNELYFLLHPRKIDFVLTTSPTEILTLISKGWKDVSRLVLIYKNPGNGRKKLHRFYHTRNSDHLFTKNYSEGINAGYKYEGVTGWVY